MSKNKRILVIAGPTGVGESTITKTIIKKYPIFTRLIAATTRKPRAQEKHKVDYYFLSEEQFKQEIKKGNIIEYQNTRNKIYYGSWGPDLKKKLKQGYNIITNLDVAGARFYKNNYNAATIFIAPESIKDLKQRLLARQPDIPAAKLRARLAYARYELKEESPFYDYIVINQQNQLVKAIKEVEEIIKKEGYKLKKRKV